MRHELAAAGVRRDLWPAFAECRAIAGAHGRSYFLATRLLPASKRPWVHALYAFARVTDDLVDEPRRDPGLALKEWSELARAAVSRGSAPSPVLAALAETYRRWDLDRDHLEAFLASMSMDLSTSSYSSVADLMTYVHGSAEVIGLQLLPVLGAAPGAAGPAAALGVAFQLTNFVRDVGEDLRRGRLYLPLEDLEACGVTVADLRRGVVTEPVRQVVRLSITRARTAYDEAAPGLALLHPSSRPCVAAATELYRGILDEVERSGCDVLSRRAVVPQWRRALVAGRAWRDARPWHTP